MDSSGRLYEIAIQATPDGAKAIAFLLCSPWGEDVFSTGWGTTLLSANGQLHLFGNWQSPVLDAAGHGLVPTTARARKWCLAMSYFMETGCAVALGCLACSDAY